MFSLDWLRRLFGNKQCRDCQGRGRWQTTTVVNEISEVQTYYCETCHGRGFIIPEEEGDDFDLAGVGVTEGDQDD